MTVLTRRRAEITVAPVTVHLSGRAGHTVRIKVKLDSISAHCTCGGSGHRFPLGVGWWYWLHEPEQP